MISETLWTKEKVKCEKRNKKKVLESLLCEE